MKRALMLASVASMIDQFNRDNISLLEKLGYQVDVACNFEEGSTTSRERVQNFQKELTERGISTFSLSIPRKITAFSAMKDAYVQLKKLCKERQYEIVHCHSPIGGVIARLACKELRKKGTKVIYTAHGFHFYTGAPFKNWLLYYPVERWMARYTDVLITICKEDYERASRQFSAKTVTYIPGVGVDTKKIMECSVDPVLKKREIHIPDNGIIILSVGELNENKNHKVVLQAIAALGREDVYYVICGQGAKKEELQQFAVQLKVERQLRLLGYRSDISEWAKTADVFAFPSYREGLPVSLMEGMAAGLAVVASKIRGNVDLIVEGKGGILVNPSKSEEFLKGLEQLIENPSIRRKQGQFNQERIRLFSLENVSRQMEEIYKECS